MSGRRRGLAVATLVALASTGLAGCGEKAEIEKNLLSMIQSTSRLSNRFAYLDQDLSGTRIEVVGLLEDDFRYKARVLFDGEPMWDEVVSDDALADRFLDPQKVLEFGIEQTKKLRESGAPPEAAPPAAPGAAPAEAPAEAPAGAGAGSPFADGTVPPFETLVNIAPPQFQQQFKALAERRWVLDKVGAPSLVVSANDKRPQGSDPFFDALTVLDYTRKAVDASLEVRKYDKDSLEPTYKPEDDPFPKPENGAGVVRYDLKEPALPTNTTSSSGAVRQILPPTAVHFRKMAIYVKGNRIVEIREEIDVQRKLKDLARNYDLDFPKGIAAEEQVQFAVEKINELGRTSTNPPVRVRQMTMQFRDFGDPTIKVELPTEDVVEGPIFGLIPNRGRPPKRTGPPSGGGSAPAAGSGGPTDGGAPVAGEPDPVPPPG